jgi:predicted RNase H-like HicB family nuclease
MTSNKRLTVHLREIAPGRFRATCPDLIGCVVYGRTPAETRQKITQAVENCLASDGTFLLGDPADLMTFHDA